jgi:hypothetical protein
VIRGWTGSFAWCALLFIVLGSIAGINGWRAGRASHVNASTRSSQPEAGARGRAARIQRDRLESPDD